MLGNVTELFLVGILLMVRECHQILLYGSLIDGEGMPPDSSLWESD